MLELNKARPAVNQAESTHDFGYLDDTSHSLARTTSTSCDDYCT